MISETTETDTKRCRKCDTTKPKSEFHKGASNADGLQSWCKPCGCAYARAWPKANPAKARATDKAWRIANPAKARAADKARRIANPTRIRDVKLKCKYGITQDTWDTIFAAQGSRCIITQADDPGSRNGWATDHCHDGNFVRGILTPAANTALGSLKDDPLNFASAMIYLAVNGRRLTPEEWSNFCAVYTPLCTQQEAHTEHPDLGH